MSPRGDLYNEQIRAETLSKITSAALEVFAEYGYNGATMKQIAKATGFSYGLVYHYFPSKEKIFCSLVDLALESSLSTIEAGLNVIGTAWKKLNSLSALIIKNALTGESSFYFLIMMQALTQGKSIPGLLDYIGERSRVHYEKLVPVIIKAQKEGAAAKGDPIVLTAAYFSFIQGLAFLVFGGQGLEKSITPEILVNVLKK